MAVGDGHKVMALRFAAKIGAFAANPDVFNQDTVVLGQFFELSVQFLMAAELVEVSNRLECWQCLQVARIQP
jgi:hypothetical protein